MKDLLQQMKWQFTILNRNNIVSISLVVTVIYGLVFYAIKNLGNTDKVLTLFILNDPAIIGLFFIGLSIILEKNQMILSALFVSPLNYHIYLISRILVLSLIGWVCALGMAFSALGFTFQLFHFTIGVLGICSISCLLGIYLVCYNSQFLLFLLKSIPVLIFIIGLPLVNYFGVSDIFFFKLMPSQGSIYLIANSYLENPNHYELIFGYVSLILWISFLYWFTYRTFIKKMVNV